jgi:uncharacterized protein YuzB (UPF0349 family)
MSAGRKKDPIWVYFIEVPTATGKGCRAKCKVCAKEIQGLVARLKAHHEKCREGQDQEEVDEPDVNVPTAAPGPVAVAGSSLTSRGDREDAHHAPAPPAAKRSCKTLDGYLIKTTPQQKELFDEQAARFIFATNSAFRSIEHPEFKKYSAMLRPGYSPPNRHEVGGKLLDKVFQKESEKCAAVLKNECVCMTIDGWSNVHNEPIVCACVINKSGEVFLVDTIDTSGNAHTAEYLTQIALKTIKSTQDKFNCFVRSFVTDNASNMAKMREELEKGNDDDNIDVITYGCSAHLLNLLAKDLVVGNVKEHVVQIIKYFRNTHLPKAWYHAAGGSALILPQDVRWNTLCDCLEAYIKNWSLIMKVCEEHRDAIEGDIQNKVRNMGIKRNAEDLLKRLKPIAIALDSIQRDNCTIAKAVEIWKRLEKELEDAKILDRNTKRIFKLRYNQAITPAHCLAYLVSPTLIFSDKKLTAEEKEAALKFASETYTDTQFLPTVIKFIGRVNPFNDGPLFDKNLINSMTDIEWWHSFNAIKEVLKEPQIKLLEQLLTATSSSAGVERIFSSFGLVHSKLRNRLGVEKAGKLVFLMRRLNNEQLDPSECGMVEEDL